MAASRLEISGVNHVDIIRRWGQYSPFLAKALKHGDGLHDLASYRRACEEREAQLWTIFTNQDLPIGAFLTEVHQFPLGRALSVPLVGGKYMRAWLPAALSLLHAYAKEHNCKLITGFSRPGWERVLKPYGWKQTNMYVCEVSDGQQISGV